MDKSLKLVRCISVYEKASDEFVTNIMLEKFPFEEVSSHFNLGDDPRMFLCYDITSAIQADIEELLGVELDLDRYDYMLECGTTDNPELPGEPLGELNETTGYPPPLDPPAWIEGAVKVKPETPG